MGIMKKFVAASLLLLPLIATAAEEPIRVADNATTPPRFFSLDAVRNGQHPQAKLRDSWNAKSAPPLRSDAAALDKGFLRIDRKTTMPTAPQHSLIVYPTEPPTNTSDTPRIIRGGAKAETSPTTTAQTPEPVSSTTVSAANADPVLALFNANDSAALPTFRDGLSGRIGTTPSAVPSAGGLVHQWPIARNVAQKITSGFGYRNDPIDNKMEFHNGIDISAAMGTPVLASADGHVSEVTEDGLFGKSVSVQHRNGSVSQYGHLSAQTVSVGQQVKAGQIIGKVGATGRVTGAHLHYCITQNGIKLDPMKLLGQPATIDTAAANTTTTSHVYPGSPMVTRPRAPSRSEKLIIVR
jgi:murein DD-endopeptidase MepM/ murein hydrolase activator NlpD